MKIYVASSWRNIYQETVVHILREMKHEVYDFKEPMPGCHGFSWSEIDPAWKQWTPYKYREALSHPVAHAGYGRDFAAMRWADCFVGVLPYGCSASAEMGWAAGNGKKNIAFHASPLRAGAHVQDVRRHLHYSGRAQRGTAKICNIGG